ncbi:unnamed protein product [Parajaminaea phylloscopi]
MARGTDLHGPARGPVKETKRAPPPNAQARHLVIQHPPAHARTPTYTPGPGPASRLDRCGPVAPVSAYGAQHRTSQSIMTRDHLPSALPLRGPAPATPATLNSLISGIPNVAASSVVVVKPLPSSGQHVTPSKQLSRRVDGIDTNVVVQEYVDRTMVIVTQNGKIGSVIQASLPTTASPYVPLKSTLFADDDALLGGDESDDDPARDATHGQSAWIPPPPPDLLQSTLLGAPPSGYASMYSLYVSSIFAILRPGPEDSLDPDAPQQKDARPVIVALSLRLPSPGKSSGDVDEENVEEMAIAEGQRFRDVLTLVRDCTRP